VPNHDTSYGMRAMVPALQSPLRPNDSQSKSMRLLHTPSGRRWTAALFYIPAAFATAEHGERAAACPAVLRFESHDLVLDLFDWPDDWMLLSDNELGALLRRAQLAVFASTPTRRTNEVRSARGVTSLGQATDHPRPYSVLRHYVV
jgi:hypothetical protein